MQTIRSFPPSGVMPSRARFPIVSIIRIGQELHATLARNGFTIKEEVSE